MAWLEQQVNLKNDSMGLLKTLLKEKYWSGEVEIHPDNTITFYAILSISMVADTEYNIEHYIVNLQNITDIKEAHQRIERMAFYDSLTGLANRQLAIEYINTTIKHHHRHNTFSSLLYINIDRFKSINDAFGRKTGDRFLKKIAEVLQKILRDEDNIARIGGDEFVVATQDSETNLEIATRNANKLALKISNALNHQFIVDDLKLHSSARIGLIVFPSSQEDTAETLLINADLAVSKAKELKKRHKIHFYESILTEEMKSLRQLEHELNDAHKKGEIHLFYQAQMGSENTLYGAETLVRWIHPKLGFIPPDKFISIAEESRQILKLGAWIMYHAFMQAKKWAKNSKDFNLSINISPIQFHEADFIDNVIAILSETKTDAKNITLELTEGILISDTESAIEKIARLVELGFKVSIDDFGTGYSSLSYFQRLPIHELKIDKSFIARVPESKENVAIVESILHLANTKKLAIVAEGVESKEQIEFLHKRFSDILIQGYYYSKPCHASEFEKIFLRNPSEKQLELA
jgi:diguanylate cyclase (GGDEF)-like protein